MTNEKQITASNYLILFAQEVEGLNRLGGIYLNTILRLRTMYGLNLKRLQVINNEKIINKEEELKKIDEEEAKLLIKNLSKEELNQLNEVTDSIRQLVFQSFMRINSLTEKIPSFQKTITSTEKYYNEITSVISPDIQIIQKYILELNKCLINEIINDLLIKAQEIYGEFNANE